MPDLVLAEQHNIERPTLLRKPDFPDFVDNSGRGNFIACPTKWCYSMLFSIAPAGPAIHLHAGGAFARGVEVARKAFWQEQKTPPEAKRDGLQALIQFYGPFVPPPTKQGDKSLDNVIRAFDSYFQRYPLESDPIKPFKAADGKYMIEFTFSIPTEVLNPSTGVPILYQGRCDMIGMLYDSLFVTDEKTATQLGEQWASQWDLESQFTGYIYAAQKHGFPVAGALIRGVGLLKTKISHAEAQVYRKSWEIERWWKQLQKDIRRMVQQYEAFDFDMALAKGACAAYGGCEFKILCQSPEPEKWMNQYRIRRWKPTEKDFGERLLETAPLQEHPNDDLSIDLDKLLP